MNNALFHYLNAGIKSPFLDGILPMFSERNYLVIPALVLIGLMIYWGSRRTRFALVALVVALILSDFVNDKVIKRIFQEPRPYLTLEGVNVCRDGEWTVPDPKAPTRKPSPSFPSSHASNIAAIAMVLGLMSRRSLWAMVPLAALVGVSRVYTGNHYPGDVLGGYAAGVVWGGIAWWLVFRFANRNKASTPAVALSRWATASQTHKCFLGLVALWTIVNFWFIYLNVFDLAGDEAQYWDWSRRLSLGYYSKPPLIGYFIFLLTKLGGHHEFAIRSGAVLAFSGSLLLLYALTVRITKSEATGLLAGVIAMAMPSSWAGSVLITIDAPLIFCWMLAMYAFHRAVNGDKRYWILVGAALGLGMLAKYTMALLLVSFVLYLMLVDKSHWRSKGPYLAFVLMVLMMSGVIYWNATNDWISIKHTAAIGAGTRRTLLKSIGRMFEFLGAQAGGVTSPILFGFFAWALWTLRKRFKENRDAAFLVLCFSVLFGFYLLVSLVRSPQANWPACAYLSAAPALAWVWSERERTVRARKWLVAGLILGCVMGIAARSTDLLYLAGIPFGEGKSVDRLHLLGATIVPDKDPTSKLRGGSELGEALSKYTVKNDPAAPFLMSDRYQITAWAAFYTKGYPQVYCMNFGDRRFNQYDLWGGAETLVGRDAIFVTGGDETKAHVYIDGLVQAGAFKSGQYMETVRVMRGKTQVKSFIICRLNGYTGIQAEPTTAKY